MKRVRNVGYTAQQVMALGCYCVAISRKERTLFMLFPIFAKGEGRNVLKRDKDYTDYLVYPNCQ